MLCTGGGGLSGNNPACVCVHAYAYVNACMRACVCACVRACMRAYVRVCAGVQACACACVCMPVSACVPVWMHACVGVFVDARCTVQCFCVYAWFTLGMPIYGEWNVNR